MAAILSRGRWINRDLQAYWYMWQRIPDNTMSSFARCTIVVDVHGTEILVDGKHDVAPQCHILIWMRTVRQMVTHWHSGDLRLKYAFYRWTGQIIHNTLIYVDRYRWLMGDKTNPESTESCLELFYIPFVAGINLPHQGAADSYNL